MSAFESGIDQFFPDFGKLMDLCAKEVDSLAAGDFGVEAVLFGDLAERNKLIGRDLTAGDAGDDRIESAALHVGEEAIIRVLQRVVRTIGDLIVPQAGENRRHSGFADFAAAAFAVRSEQFVERTIFLDLDDLEQLLPGVRKVFAEVAIDGLAGGGEFFVQDVGDQWQAAATAGAGFRAGFDRANRGEILLADGRAKLALGDVIARTDLAGIAERFDAAGRGSFADDQFAGGHRQRFAAFLHRGKHAVFRGIADQDTADEMFAFGVEQQLFVDAGERVFVHERFGDVGAGFVVAEAGDVDAHQFELRRQVRAGEALVLPAQIGRDRFGHIVARRNQAVDETGMQGDLADGEHARVRGAEFVVDLHAAALADFDTAFAGQIVAGTNARGDDDHVDIEPFAVVEDETLDCAVADDLLGRFVEMDADAQVLDLSDQRPRAGVVDLTRHEARSKLDDVRFETEIVGRLGCFKAQ